MTKKTNEKTRKPARPKRSKKFKKKKKQNTIIALIILVFSFGFILDHFNQTYIYGNTIAENMFVEGIDVSEMTKEAAIEEINNKIKPQGITLSYNDKNYIISPEEIDLKYNIESSVNSAYDYTKTDSYFENIKRYFSLKKVAKDINLKTSYDETKLTEAIEKISNDVNIKTVNAKVFISHSGSISSTSSTTGKELDIANTKELIYNMIESKNREIINLKVNTKEPNVKTEDAKSVNTLLAQFSTSFKDSPNRVENISIAARRTSDILLMPGEVFSYNNLTGMRTKSNGYKDAPVIVNGELQEGLGGGVCQVSTTLYNSVLTSGLSINAVTNHSLISSYAPIGQDAMVNDSGTDFKFKNPFSHPIYVKTTVANNTVTSKIYGNTADKKNISVKVERFKENGRDAAKTYRVYKDETGKEIRTEYVAKSVYKNPKN